MNSLKVLEYKLKKYEEMEGVFILEVDDITIFFRNYFNCPENNILVLGHGSIATATIDNRDVDALLLDLFKMRVPLFSDLDI